MPIPIQSASMSDRLRKFFRIRGKTGFTLDEVVAPVVLVQDLTKGPYQAGVTPAGGTCRVVPPASSLPWAFAVILNDKPGSITPVLDRQFDDRSFSFTWAEFQNISVTAGEMTDIHFKVAKRSDVVAAGVPSRSEIMFQIQNGDGVRTVPVEIYSWDTTDIPGGDLWRGPLGDNTNTLGSRRRFESIEPNVTIGPKEALIISSPIPSVLGGSLQASFRGFYQEQPA